MVYYRTIMEHLDVFKEPCLLPSSKVRKLLKPTYREVVIQQNTAIKTARELEQIRPGRRDMCEAIIKQAEAERREALIAMQTIAALCRIVGYISVPLDSQYTRGPIIAVRQYYTSLQQETGSLSKAA